MLIFPINATVSLLVHSVFGHLAIYCTAFHN